MVRKSINLSYLGILLSVIFSNITIQANDTTKVNNLYKIAWDLAPSNFEKCILFADSALKISEKISWEKGIVDNLNLIGEANRFKGNIKEAIEKHELALKISKSKKYKKGIADSHSKLGVAYFHISDYPKAFENFDIAGKMFENLDDKNGIRNCYNYMGILNTTLGNFSEGISYFEKALEISESLNDKLGIGTQLGNIGRVYFEIHDFKNAIIYYNQAVESFEEINDDFNKSVFSANSGLAYLKLRDYNRAYFNFKSALNYSESIKNDLRIAFQNENLGELKYTMAIDKNLQNSLITKNELLLESITFSSTALEIFQNLGIKDEIQKCNLLLSKTYEEKGDYKNSLAYYKAARSLQDSIFSIENKKVLAKLEIAQQLKLKDKEIELLIQAKSHQNFVRTTIISLAVLFFVISLFFLRMFIKKRKQNIELEKNIRIRKETELLLLKNEKELKKHQEQLEELVSLRTKKLEEEIRERKRTEEDLILAVERSETASNAKSTFLANMSHELRTPLTGILGYSEILSKEINDLEKRTMAEGIYRTGSRLLNTLSMILDFARVESDRYEVNYREINIIPEIVEIFNSFKGIAAIKGLDYELKLQREVEILYIDVSMLRVIVENLINNAIKFTDTGSVVVETESNENTGNDVFLLRVRDTGIGMNKKNIPMIFKEFKQISEGTNKAYPGTGLGLSIAKKYIKILNGEINVKTALGFGSTFEIRFSKNQVIIKQSA
ncbi:MAG: tetratricopeptide repeat-containing sensor histidine kinase [Melioribacteraceae bacterium]